MRWHLPRSFLIWFSTAVVLGGLPWFVNLLVQWLSANVAYLTIFRVPELMYFAITVNATCVLSLLGEKPGSPNSFVAWLMLSLLLIIVAALFLGIVSYLASNPPASSLFRPVMKRLVLASIMLCILTLAATVSLQWQLCVKAEAAPDLHEEPKVHNGR